MFKLSNMMPFYIHNIKTALSTELHLCKIAEHEVDVPCLTWPTNAPDLNVIENIRDMLEWVLQKKHQHPHNLTALCYQLFTEWVKLDVNIILSHIDSMPNKIKAVMWDRSDMTSS